MTKLTGAALDRAVANSMGLKSVNNCEQWGKEMTDLTEKNLEAVLLNLTKTDKPIKVKPTTWFNNPAKTAQWYRCPNCAKQSPLTHEWVGLTEDERYKLWLTTPSETENRFAFAEAIEQALKERNT